MRCPGKIWFAALFALSVTMALAQTAGAEETTHLVEAASQQAHPWRFWPLALLIVTFIMGILAVLGGVGGGVLFVPIISGFFPIHLDFVRGAISTDTADQSVVFANRSRARTR